MQDLAFVSTTATDSKICSYAKSKKIPVLGGVRTTEQAVRAVKDGCAVLKIYPCVKIGDENVKRIVQKSRTLFPHIPILLSGGVNSSNAIRFWNCGADMLALGFDLKYKTILESINECMKIDPLLNQVIHKKYIK